MTSEAGGSRPESKDFRDAIEYLEDPMNIEKLKRLLSSEVWQTFVAAAKLPRAEADALYGELNQLRTLMNTEGKDMSSEDRLHTEKFLDEFPRGKEELEESIAQLRALADEVDRVHRDCTISNVVASSTGAASGVLTIAGLALTPVTAGASLVLLATGAGLGAAAAVTSVSSSIVEHSKNVSAKDKASRLVSAGTRPEKLDMQVLSQGTLKIVSLAKTCTRSLQAILKNARVFKLARANPLLAENAKLYLNTGASSARGGGQLETAIAGSALAMTKGARIVAGVTAGVFLLVDLICLVKESKRLHDGPKARSATELREQARELESRLEQLSDIYKILQDSGTQ